MTRRSRPGDTSTVIPLLSKNPSTSSLLFAFLIFAAHSRFQYSMRGLLGVQQRHLRRLTSFDGRGASFIPSSSPPGVPSTDSVVLLSLRSNLPLLPYPLSTQRGDDEQFIRPSHRIQHRPPISESFRPPRRRFRLKLPPTPRSAASPSRLLELSPTSPTRSRNRSST